MSRIFRHCDRHLKLVRHWSAGRELGVINAAKLTRPAQFGEVLLLYRQRIKSGTYHQSNRINHWCSTHIKCFNQIQHLQNVTKLQASLGLYSLYWRFDLSCPNVAAPTDKVTAKRLAEGHTVVWWTQKPGLWFTHSSHFIEANTGYSTYWSSVCNWNG